MMDKHIYVYLMENVRPLDEDVVRRHVEHLRALDSQGALVLCGPFTDYAGGMVALRAASYQQACEIASSDPFIAEGYKTCAVRTLETANAENGYLLD